MTAPSDDELENLNKAQLVALLNSIDRKKQPKVAAKIQSFIQSEDIFSGNFSPKDKRRNKIFPALGKKPLPAWSHLVLAGLLFLIAIYIQVTGKFPIGGFPLTLGGSDFIKFSFVVISIGAGIFSVVHYFLDRNK